MQKTVPMDNPFSHPDDASLVRRAQEGEEEAFAALVRRHAGRFYSVAYRVVFDKEDAEDIVQEAFLKLWDGRARWDPKRKAKFTTWFYTVVLHLCRDHNRKKRPLPLLEEVPLAENGPGQEDTVSRRQEKALLERFIRELPERQQLALTLCFYEGLSNREAAAIMGIKLKALQSLIMRAKTHLKERFKKDPVRGTR